MEICTTPATRYTYHFREHAIFSRPSPARLVQQLHLSRPTAPPFSPNLAHGVSVVLGASKALQNPRQRLTHLSMRPAPQVMTMPQCHDDDAMIVHHSDHTTTTVVTATSKRAANEVRRRKWMQAFIARRSTMRWNVGV